MITKSDFDYQIEETRLDLEHRMPARALARLHWVLSQLDLKSPQGSFDSAIVFLYMARASRQLHEPRQAERYLERAQDILRQYQSLNSREHLDIFLSLAERLSEQDAKVEARHFATSTVEQISENPDSYSNECIAETLQRYANIAYKCGDKELARASRIVSLLFYQFACGLEFEPSKKLLTEDLPKSFYGHMKSLSPLVEYLGDRYELSESESTEDNHMLLEQESREAS